MLTRNELERFSRQIQVQCFGKEGQERLGKAKVFIAGVGGLGSAVSMYLAAAGIGTMRLVDQGTIELSNLNRQILYRNEDIGRSKVVVAAKTLKALNPEARIEGVQTVISGTNISGLMSGFDVLVDALDNLEARYVLNRAAAENKVPLVHGAVHAFQGRITTIIPGRTVCLKCLYRGQTVPRRRFMIVGVTVGIIGCIQATEVIKYLLGIGNLLVNRLLVYDGLMMQFNEFKVMRDPKCECANLTPKG